MANESPNNYLFLNCEGRWPNFHRFALEVVHDGTLQLSSVPLLSTPLPEAVRTAPEPDGPSGIVIDRNGNLYFTQPDSNTLNVIQGCDSSLAPFPCVRGGTSGAPGVLDAPRGLLIPPNHSALFVADSGNHRIQIFDLNTYRLLEIWGASAPWAGSQPGSFDTPWTMAADEAGNIYVVDYGNQRVQKFNFLGDVIASFAQNVAASGKLHKPVDVAIRTVCGKTQVFITDSSPAQILVFDDTGNPVLDSSGSSTVVADPHLTKPMGLAITGDALYVGDNSARRIFRFQIGDKPAFVGEAIGYDGPIAGLFLDHKNNLWVHPGDSLAPIPLSTDTGHGALGAIWSIHPISAGRAVQWHRLLALLEPLSSNSHFDLFAYASDKPTDTPSVDVNATNPFSDPRWHSFPSLANIDLTDIYLGGAQKQYIWVGALFSSDGTGSPKLSQLRIEYDWPTYDPYLPAIYRNQGKCGDFLPRLLSLFQSFFAGVEHEIGALPALFDPAAVRPSFIPWLAGCLGLDVDQSWTVAKQRDVLAQIFEYYAKRGTAEGLREALRLFAGVNAQVDEPILNAAWWSLPGTGDACCEGCAAAAAANGTNWTVTGNSVLGWTTMLPPAQPQGAIVGTTADLDQSHLITDKDFGAPLFTDVAYQFRVQVYKSQAGSPEALAKIRAILDNEKPAHTTYQLCVIEPAFRIGFQSNIGVDTVVGGPPHDLRLGSKQALGVDSALGGTPAPRLGDGTRLGVSTRLA
jgi:phage tail-like protein